jgi:hypothetical protein
MGARSTGTTMTTGTTSMLGASGRTGTATTGFTGGTVSTLGARTSGTTRVVGTAGVTGGISTGTVSNVGTIPGTLGSGVGTGTVGVVGGTAGLSAPTTTATMAGVLPQRASGVLTTGAVTVPTTSVGTLANTGTVAAGNPNAAGLPGGINTNTVGTSATAGTGTVSFPGAVGTASTSVGSGTITLGGSPFASVIPSLPSVVGQLNVVPPPAMAPASPETLPVGAARDLAAHDYDAGVSAMALKANEIDAHWFRYRDSCLRDNAVTADIDNRLYGGNRDRQWFVLFDEDVRTPADDNCRQLRVELNRMATDWRDTMTRLEDTARRNDVLPGSMRETRQRYRVDF